MNTAVNKASWPLHLAFMLGRYTARRDNWMRDARVAKLEGRGVEVIRQRVKFARDYNPEAVHTLRLLRQAGAL